MKQPNEETRQQMAAAAELRAAGLTWEAIARQLGVSDRTCRRWTEAFAEFWRKLLRRAESQHERDCRAEARVVLRKLLRDGEEKSKLNAATQLLKKPHRRRQSSGGAALREEDAALAAYISLVRGMDDHELREQLAAHLEAQDAAVRELDSPGENIRQ